MYRELMDFKARKNVPIVACLMDIAASGGYYIAMASDAVHAHPTTVTGSIGVLAVKFNAKGLLDKIGVVNETITSASLKDSMSPFRGMTEQERMIMQTILDEMHGRFTDVVQAGRPRLSAQDVVSVADGRIFTAGQALEAGLIDRIGYLDGAIEAAEQMAGIESGSRVVMYHRPYHYKNNIYSQSSINLINIGGDGNGQSLPMRFMYLWTP
jgi:protease-4